MIQLKTILKLIKAICSLKNLPIYILFGRPQSPPVDFYVCICNILRVYMACQQELLLLAKYNIVLITKDEHIILLDLW